MFIDSYSHNYPSIPIPIPAQFPKAFAAELSTFPSPVPVLEFERLSLDINPAAGVKTNTSTSCNSNPNPGCSFGATETALADFRQPPLQKQSIFIPTQSQPFMSIPIQNMATSVPNQTDLNMSWEPTSTTPPPPPPSSLQSRLTPRTTLLPLSLLLRPLPPQHLSQSKVTSMLHTLSSSDPSSSLPPIDVLYYKNPKTGREFYFAFGGCHRLSAWERAGREIVECKVLRVTRGMLGGYLGGSLGRVLGEEEE